MNDFPHLLRAVLGGGDLSAATTARAIGAIMDETLSDVRAAALLAALTAKGETVDELIGAATAMRERSIRVLHDRPITVDVCGTGGDGAETINISTAVAFVVAGAGVPVAKHGNRAASNPCGSADVLEFLGVRLDRSPDVSARLLRDNNIAFMFAQYHHPAMRAVGRIRRELGVRTMFNVLGPLTNPAGATHQVVGVSNDKHVDLVARALFGLGGTAGAVVHGSNGLDEIAGDAPTAVAQFDRTGIRRWTLDPGKYGVSAPLESLRGGDVAYNAAALTAILEGERSPRADLVCLNAALALVVAGDAVDIDDGMVRARRSIERGSARTALDALRAEREMEYA
ncbi:MAG: anthranilate phosphoribosyltransferase [Candidatus Velthaea sp.]